MKNRFKVLTSFTLFYTFLVVSVSGFILYISPKGRIANWTNWTVWGLDKERWAAIHTVFVTVFLMAGLFHLFLFNWKRFWGYLQKQQERFRYTYELLSATTLCAVILVGALYQVPPIISVYSLGEYVKESYEIDENQPPIPHAEDLTVQEFSKQVLSLSVDEVLARLERKGYRATGPDETMGDLAKRYDVSPSMIYDAVDSREDVQADSLDHRPSAYLPSSGYGRKKLSDVCGNLGLTLEVARQRLTAAGITEANAEDTLRDIAERCGKQPVDIAHILAARD